MFKNVGEINEETKINKEEREPVRNLPTKGLFSEIEAGAGNITFKMDKRGIWVGHQNMEEAPFSVDMNGLFKLLSTIGGGGAVGFSAEKGIWVGAETFEEAPFSVDINGVFRIKAQGESGKYIGIDAQQGIWLGAETFEEAPFSVDTSGNMKFKAVAGAEDLTFEWEDGSGNLSIFLGFEEV